MILNEGKKQAHAEYVQSGLIAEITFNELLVVDPTPQKKYIEKMCSFFMEETESRPNDNIENIIGEIGAAIGEFHDLTGRNIISGRDKDINRYPTFLDIHHILHAHREVKSKTQLKKEEKAKLGVTVYEDDEWIIQMPFNWRGSKLFGTGTQWCITYNSPNYWFNYVWRDGDHFYFVSNKKMDAEKSNLLEKHPLYKVAAQVSKDGNLINLWDAPDNSFHPDGFSKSTDNNFVTDSDLYKNDESFKNEQRAVWIEKVPKKFWDIIKKPDTDGKKRMDFFNFKGMTVGYDHEEDIEFFTLRDVKIDDGNIHEWTPENTNSLDLTLPKKYDVEFREFERNIIISDFSGQLPEMVNDFLKTTNTCNSFTLRRCSKITQLPYIPKNVLVTVTIDDCPNLMSLQGLPDTIGENLIVSNCSNITTIEDLEGVKIRRNLRWVKNGYTPSLIELMKKKLLPGGRATII